MLIKKIMSYNNYEKDENTWYDKMTIAILNEQALCLDRTVDPWTIYIVVMIRSSRQEEGDETVQWFPIGLITEDAAVLLSSNATNTACPEPCQIWERSEGKFCFFTSNSTELYIA